MMHLKQLPCWGNIQLSEFVTTQPFLSEPFLQHPWMFRDRRWAGRIIPAQSVTLVLPSESIIPHCFQTPCSVYKPCEQSTDAQYDATKSRFDSFEASREWRWL
jgi:hypothetical protein